MTKTNITNRSKVIAFCTLTAVLLFSGSCSNKNTNQTGDSLIIVGTGDCEKILGKLAMAFNKTKPGYKVIVPESIGSGGGIKAVGKDEYVLGRVARPLKESEAESGLSYLPFAKDPVVFAVGDKVNVKTLTQAQLLDIFSGKTTNWRNVSGAASPIRVLVREEGDIARSIVEKNIVSFKNIEPGSHAKLVYHSYEMIALLEKYDTAIGYLTSSSANPSIHPIAVDGITPTLENVNAGKYKLICTYAFIYKEKKLNKHIRKFLNFVFSEQGRDILESNKLIPIDKK